MWETGYHVVMMIHNTPKFGGYALYVANLSAPVSQGVQRALKTELADAGGDAQDLAMVDFSSERYDQRFGDTIFFTDSKKNFDIVSQSLVRDFYEFISMEALTLSHAVVRYPMFASLDWAKSPLEIQQMQDAFSALDDKSKDG